MINTPCISNEREYRILKQLLIKPTFRKELNDTIGAINPPHNIMQMRKCGWVLPCMHIQIVDRDGKKCRPGVYSLHPNEIEIAKHSVEIWEKKKGVRAPLSPDK